MLLMRVTFFLGFAIAFGYAALMFWRRRNVPVSKDGSEGFRPKIGFTRLDGMASLSLLLSNGSDANIWVEEIEIFLSGLAANEQTAEPSCHEILKVRQMVLPKDVLPISLVGVIYKAAGDPQRDYSCVLSSMLRFRIGEKSFEKPLQNYRIRMIGLTASGVSKERKPVPPFKIQPPDKSDKGKDVAAPAGRSR